MNPGGTKLAGEAAASFLSSAELAGLTRVPTDIADFFRILVGIYQVCSISTALYPVSRTGTYNNYYDSIYTEAIIVGKVASWGRGYIRTT